MWSQVSILTLPNSSSPLALFTPQVIYQNITLHFSELQGTSILLFSNSSILPLLPCYLRCIFNLDLLSHFSSSYSIIFYLRLLFLAVETPYKEFSNLRIIRSNFILDYEQLKYFFKEIPLYSMIQRIISLLFIVLPFLSYVM